MRSELIQYFKNCYQADNRNQALWNIFSKKYQFLRFYNLEQAMAFYADQPVTLPPGFAKKLAVAVKTYRREKNLVFCSHFIVGNLSEETYGKTTSRKICAPLFFTSASALDEGSFPMLRGDSDSLNWNTPLLYQLVGSGENVEKLIAKTNELKLHMEDPSYIATAVIDRLNELSGAESFIESECQLTNSEDFQALVRSTKLKGKFSLVSSFASILLDRSTSSRGILDELEMMAVDSKSSVPLRQIDPGYSATKTNAFLAWINAKNIKLNNVPGILSESQKQVFEQLSKNPLTMLIGPPGTGKSYTIASIALERFMQGESVLIVSQNEHAVDVIKHKLTTDFKLSPNAVMRAGTKDHHRNLKRYLDKITKGAVNIKPGKSVNSELNALSKAIKSNEKLFLRRLKTAREHGKLLSAFESQSGTIGFLEKIRFWLANREIDNNDLLQRELAVIQKLNKNREEILSHHINNIFLTKLEKTLRKNRKELVRLRSALGARTSHKQDKVFSEINFNTLLKTMPIWLCSLEALHKSLPLKCEMFDLVIFDEATQCDISSCLPALYRAKRALIVGDPKQLRHVSFLSRERQQQIAEKSGLDNIDLSYRDHSMVDLADQSLVSQDFITTLDEHFRSAPQIIQFSNQKFYDSKLRVMRERPVQGGHNAVSIMRVQQSKRMSGVNKKEAKAILHKLRTLVDSQSVIPSEFKQSFGVLSFFRAQAEHLQKSIFKAFTFDEIAEHNIRAGTPYAFQGEERDIMLLSCVVDENSNGGTFAYLNRADMFNVAVTRAKEKQYVFVSLANQMIPLNNLLRQYLESVESYKQVYEPNISHRIEVIDEFASTLIGRGFQTLLNYMVAGFEMDIVLLRDNEILAIDLVGFPGEENTAFQLERYRIFERAGLKILPISYGGWKSRRKKIVEMIEREFLKLQEKNKIANISLSSDSQQWIKLLVEDFSLAEKVRKIEAKLIALKFKQPLEQLRHFIDLHFRLLTTLNEKLNPSEITHARYMGISRQTLDFGVDNLSKIADLKFHEVNSTSESLSQTSNQQTLASAIEVLLNENHEAIESAEALTIKWSLLSVESSSSNLVIGDVLSDLKELKDKVERYSLDKEK